MKAAERSARNALIETMFLSRVPQVEIGRRLGLNAPRVHAILQGRGLLPPPNANGREKAGGAVAGSTRNSIWDHAEGDRLRRAIYKREREGAKAALLAMMEKHDG